jgi:hypothetical protein
MNNLIGRKKSNSNENSETKPTSGISLMKHNRLRVLSESSSNKIISSNNDLLINSTENFMFKKNITITEKKNQLKKKKYYLRKNSNNYKSNSSIDINSRSSSNNDISDSEISESPRHAPLLSAQSYSVGTKNNKNKVLEKTNTQIYNNYNSTTSDPSTLAQPIRQELQIKAKESISDVILACRSLIQTSNINNDLSKTAYNFSLLDSVFSDIDNSITKINQNLNTCKQKNEDIMKSLNELSQAQEDSRRIKDLVVAYITE